VLLAFATVLQVSEAFVRPLQRPQCRSPIGACENDGAVGNPSITSESGDEALNLVGSPRRFACAKSADQPVRVQLNERTRLSPLHPLFEEASMRPVMNR
jgi:hypothetical protein